MKKSSLLLLAVLSFLPAMLHAVSYPITEKGPSHVKSEDAMTVGTKLYLFHSGTDEVRKSIQVNDVLTVYREYPSDLFAETVEVGKVRVLALSGDYYFTAEVIGGDVTAGDLAKKGTVACFITAFKKNGRQQ